MASPITTSGFHVSAVPGINYPDPRLMAPALGGIIPAAGQGMGVAGDFFTMRENAQLRPTRRALADIQLQEAKNRMAMAPLEQQLAALRLGEAQQRAAIPTEIVESVDIIGGGKRLAPLNPSASFEDFTIMEEFAPRVKRTGGTRVAAGGVTSPFMRDETMASGEQVRAEAEKRAQELRSAEALAQQRTRGRQFESTALAELYTNAMESGDAEAASLYKARLDRLNRAPGFLPEGTAYQRRIETMAADAGLTLAAANELAKTPEGAEALAQLAVRNKAVARDPLNAAFAPKLTAPQQALVAGAGRPAVGVDEVFATTSGGGKRTAPSTFTYTSVEEAESAINSGGHIPGDKITVGTQTFTVQE